MRVNIDFSGQPQRAPALAVLLLCAAFVVCASVLWACGSVFADYRQYEDKLAGARLTAKQAHPGLSPKRIEAVNHAIGQLNLPWLDLFDAVERTLSTLSAPSTRISLLSLEPDAASQILRIQAEAKSADDMLDFVAALAAESFFRSAILIRHEINANDPNKPYRFTLEAQWGNTP